jgi:hypothetical protein
MTKPAALSASTAAIANRWASRRSDGVRELMISPRVDDLAVERVFGIDLAHNGSISPLS